MAKPYLKCPTPMKEHFGIVNLTVDTRMLLFRIVAREEKRCGYKIKQNEVMRVIIEYWAKRHGVKL